MTLEPGFHRIDAKTYHADPTNTLALSASIAKKLVQRSPLHAWWAHPKGGGKSEPPTKCMVNGVRIDSMLFGGDNELVVLPERMENAKGELVATGGEYRLDSAKKWKAEQIAAGKVPTSREQFDQVTCTVALIRKQTIGLFDGGETQLTIIWDAVATSGALVRCKARLDWAKIDDDGFVIRDGKSTENASLDSVRATIERFGYDIQHAAYMQAVETIRPDLAGRGFMEFVFMETEGCCAVRRAPLAGTMAELGRRRWQYAVDKWAECLESGVFPGYGDDRIEASSRTLEIWEDKE